MIEKLIAKFGVYLAGFVGIFGLLVGVFFKGKKAARQEVKAETVDKIIDVVTKEKEIETINNDMGAESRRDELRGYANDDRRMPVDKPD